jgi:heterodisulfide reductase subunit C
MEGETKKGGINFELRKEIINVDKNIVKCFQCGTCVSSCVASVILSPEKYSPRQTFLKALYGNELAFKDKNLWMCGNCYHCYERCPKGVRPTEVLGKLKEISFSRGHAPQPVIDRVNNILATGRALSIAGSDLARGRVGLPKLEEFKFVSEIKKLGELTRGAEEK